MLKQGKSNLEKNKRKRNIVMFLRNEFLFYRYQLFDISLENFQIHLQILYFRRK